MNGRNKITTPLIYNFHSIHLPNSRLSTSFIQRRSSDSNEAFVSTFPGVFLSAIHISTRNSHSDPEKALFTASNNDQSFSYGYDPNSDVILSNKRITNFVRVGDLDSAFREFREMKTKTTASWNSLLSWYLKRPEKIRDACELFDKIPEPDSVSYNIMLACYLRSFGLNSAVNFFNSMPVKDIASWNTMISGFSQSGQMREAYEFFKIMPHKNGVTWSAMISGYIESGDLEAAKELFKEATIKSVVVQTAMITGYMKFGKVELAEEVFREMSMKNIVTWNAMIAGYVENFSSEDGLKMFKAMIGSGMRPNSSSLSSVLLGCSNLSALQMGRQIHQLVSKTPLNYDITAGTSIISMYCKCGDLENALKLFKEMPKKDVITWNSMICCYAQHGSGKKALDLFDKMKDEQMRPDWITFVAVLLACTHAGLVDLGIHYFRSMSTNFGVEARLEHYTCVVDLLGRAGRLDEAVNLIKNMPFKPHSAIFGTLLGACRIHKNLTLAEYAAMNLLREEPTSATAYVQLANVYAAMNKWDQVAKIRRTMKENNIVKTPGYSWIEVENVAHEFRSSDRRHLELAAIHEKLNELIEKMKLAGYSPVLEFALHDVEEEHKEKLLLWHSEKLAVAFGLLKLPVEAPIRVFKNLRICGDCHEAIKYISGIERREIIVRDTTRFHHFKKGACSCDNYW